MNLKSLTYVLLCVTFILLEILECESSRGLGNLGRGRLPNQNNGPHRNPPRSPHQNPPRSPHQNPLLIGNLIPNKRPQSSRGRGSGNQHSDGYLRSSSSDGSSSSSSRSSRGGSPLRKMPKTDITSSSASRGNPQYYGAVQLDPKHIVANTANSQKVSTGANLAKIASMQKRVDAARRTLDKHPNNLVIWSIEEKGKTTLSSYEFAKSIPNSHLKPFTQIIERKEGIRIHATPSHVSYFDHGANVPLVVYEHLKIDDFAGKHDKAGADFRKSHIFPHLDDFKYSKFDRAHMSSAGNFALNRKGGQYSYIASNVVAQDPKMRGLMFGIENLIRTIAINEGHVEVVTGNVYTNNSRTFGHSETVVPDMVYKVVLSPKADQKYEAICFLVKNKFDSTATVESSIVPFKELQKIIKLKLFPKLKSDQIVDSNDFKNFAKLPPWLVDDIVLNNKYRPIELRENENILSLYSFNKGVHLKEEQIKTLAEVFKDNKNPSPEECAKLAEKIGLENGTRDVQRFFIEARTYPTKEMIDVFDKIDGLSIEFHQRVRDINFLPRAANELAIKVALGHSMKQSERQAQIIKIYRLTYPNDKSVNWDKARRMFDSWKDAQRKAYRTNETFSQEVENIIRGNDDLRTKLVKELIEGVRIIHKSNPEGAEAAIKLYLKYGKPEQADDKAVIDTAKVICGRDHIADRSEAVKILNEWASTQRRQYQKTPKSGAQNFTKTVETILEKMGQKKREEFIRHLITNKRDYKTFSLEALKTIIQRVISKKYLAGLTNKDLQDIGQLMFKDENSSNLQKIKKTLQDWKKSNVKHYKNSGNKKFRDKTEEALKSLNDPNLRAKFEKFMLGDTSNLTTNPNKLENVVKFARDHKVASDAAESSLKQLAQYWNGIEYTNDTGKDLLSLYAKWKRDTFQYWLDNGKFEDDIQAILDTFKEVQRKIFMDRIWNKTLKDAHDKRKG